MSEMNRCGVCSPSRRVLPGILGGRGGGFIFAAKRRPGGSQCFYGREIREFFYLWLVDNQAESARGVCLESLKLGVTP